jgi:hypothetical protein
VRGGPILGMVTGNAPTTHELEPNLPVNFLFQVEGFDPSASRVSIVLNIYFVDRGAIKLTLRNILIQKK